MTIIMVIFGGWVQRLRARAGVRVGCAQRPHQDDAFPRGRFSTVADVQHTDRHGMPVPSRHVNSGQRHLYDGGGLAVEARTGTFPILKAAATEYLFGGLGYVVAVTDANGNVVDGYTCGPYGDTTVIPKNPSQPRGATPAPSTAPPLACTGWAAATTSRSAVGRKVQFTSSLHSRIKSNGGAEIVQCQKATRMVAQSARLAQGVGGPCRRGGDHRDVVYHPSHKLDHE